LEFDLSSDDAMELFGRTCMYCGAPPHRVNTVRGEKFTYNGIDRVDNLMGYSSSNCVPCCAKCNEVKRAMSLVDFKEYVRRLYLKLWGN
jgi:hypothetical protein